MPDETTSGVAPFNYTKFLEEFFHTPDGVLGVLAKHGLLSPQRPAVVKWFTRGSVPADWLPVLLEAIERERGVPLSMIEYRKSGEEQDVGSIFD